MVSGRAGEGQTGRYLRERLHALFFNAFLTDWETLYKALASRGKQEWCMTLRRPAPWPGVGRAGTSGDDVAALDTVPETVRGSYAPCIGCAGRRRFSIPSRTDYARQRELPLDKQPFPPSEKMTMSHLIVDIFFTESE